MKLLLLPIDNRPVTYVFPKLISKIAGVEAICPSRALMGSLKREAMFGAIASWIETSINKDVDALLLCLDTLLYGGLIPSRSSQDNLAEVLKRTQKLKEWKSQISPGAAIFAQSSIMRISDNYDATEEKAYWAKYGREIFAWSELLHRLAKGEKIATGALQLSEGKIPEKIRADYMATRMRNFSVNRALIDYAQSHIIDYLAFSQDDSGKYGLNVQEKERLELEIKKFGLDKNAFAYAGADEVLSTLIARFLIQKAGREPNIVVGFSPAQTTHCPSRYEGQTIGDTLQAQLAALGLSESPQAQKRADFLVLVHGAPEVQGDHIWLEGQPDLRAQNTKQAVQSTIQVLEKAALPCVICDVAYANGADPLLVQELLTRKDLLAKLWGYAGWNTTGNTIGSAIAQGVAFWYSRSQSKEGMSEREKTEQENKSKIALKEALFVRFADDYAYQTQIRPKLEGPVSQAELNKLMRPEIEKISAALDFTPKSLGFCQPWERTFEIEVDTAYGLELEEMRK